MRAVLTLIGIVAIGAVILIALGMLRIEQTREGALPRVAFDLKGGRLPGFKAETGSVGVGTTSKTVQVPTLQMSNTTVALPTLEVHPAGNESAPAPAK